MDDKYIFSLQSQIDNLLEPYHYHATYTYDNNLLYVILYHDSFVESVGTYQIPLGILDGDFESINQDAYKVFCILQKELCELA